MKQKLTLLTLVSSLCIVAFAQSEKKMQKHLNISLMGQFDSRSPIMFDRANPNKHGWDKTLQNFKTAFLSTGFNVIDQPTVNNITGYKLVIDYDYGYVISQYRMQYSDLKGQIVDLSKNSSIIGTFNYDGKFDLDDIAKAIALRLKNITPVTNSDLQKNDPSKNSPKSKEDKLKELKDLYEKQLITKEEYEREKKRILEEQ